MTDAWGSREHRGLTTPRPKAALRRRGPAMREFDLQKLIAEQMGKPLTDEKERNEIALITAQ